jgi:hypothetical protein
VRIASIGVDNISGLTYVEVGWYEDPPSGAARERGRKSMKMTVLMIAMIVALMSLSVPQASADGQCRLSLPKPTHDAFLVQWHGSYLCSRIHDSLSLRISLYRRPGSGTKLDWTLVQGPTTVTASNTIVVETGGSFIWDCNKDYRTVASGAAAPGNHFASGNSTILQNTC